MTDTFKCALGVAGFYEATWVGDLGDLRALFDAAVAAERERCARIVKLANVRSGFERTGNRVVGRYDVLMIEDIESGAPPKA